MEIETSKPLSKKYLAVVALNGIPRWICHDFNVEAGWVQYLIPVTEDVDHQGVSIGPYELRRFYGKVEVLGYSNLDLPDSWETNPFSKYYDAIPESTPLYPTEPYDVMPDYE